MADVFLRLSKAERADALGVASTRSGRALHLFEKDVWVVWTLSALFESAFGERLVFKGGTSLSKVYDAIRRFSEDIDVTYDIRALIPDVIGEAKDPLPSSRSQMKKWTSEIRERLPRWIKETGLPHVQELLTRDEVPAKVRAEGDNLYVDYEASVEGYGYVSPTIKVEFGARSTGEPAEVRKVICDASTYLPDVTFPVASPRVMRAERTFWEKAAALHVYCLQGRPETARFARHFYDLARLGDIGIADAAINDRDLGLAVATHKSWFFAEKDAGGEAIDYVAAVSGKLQIVPTGEALAALAAGYAKIVDDRLLLDDPPPRFEDLTKQCKAIQRQANERLAV